MYQLLTSLLNIRPQETWLVKKLFFIQFFLVLANAIMFITANTIFISSLPITELPRAYVLTAVFLFVANYGYQKLEHAVNMKVLSYLILGISITLIGLHWLWMNGSDSPMIPYFLLVAYNVMYVLLGYLFWNLAALLFNTKDSKRIFTLISAGDLPAKMITYLAIMPLTIFLGLQSMLLITLGALLIAFIMVYRLFNNEKIDILEFEHQQVHYFRKHTWSAGVSRLLRLFGSELILSLSGVAFISFLIFVFVDFTFLTEVKPKVYSDTQLATFFAIVHAVGRAGGVLIKLVFSSRMISRIGIARALLFLPLSLLVFLTGVFITRYWFPDMVNFLYVFMIMFMLIDVGKAVIQEPMFFVLFQPLKLDLRLKGHVIAKGYMYPLGMLVAGLALMSYLQTHRDISFEITSGVLALSIMIWIALIFNVRRSYVRTLQEAIRTGVFRGNELYLQGDEITQKLLLQKTESRKPAEVIYALELLQRAGYQQMNQVIQRMLGRKEHVIVNYALDWILENSGAEMIQSLEMLADSHPDEQIRAKCLYCIGTVAPGRIEQMQDLIFSQHPPICTAAVTVLLQSGNALYYKKAMDRLYQLATGSGTEKIMSADIIGKCRKPELTPLLIQLMQDADIQVQHEAIRAGGELGSGEIVLPLVEKLRHRKNVKQARHALIRLQSAAMDMLVNTPFEPNDPVIIELVRVAGSITNERSAQFLVNCLKEHPDYHKETIYALWQIAYTADLSHQSFFSDLAWEKLSEALAVAEQLSVASEHEDSIHLRRALYYELRHSTDTILRLLSFIYSRDKLNQVILALDLKESFRTSNSLELLHITLPAAIYAEVERLLEVVEMNYSLSEKKVRYRTIVEVLENIIVNAPRTYNRWTNAQAIYHTGQKKIRHLIHALKHNKKVDNEPIIHETRMFVISQHT